MVCHHASTLKHSHASLLLKVGVSEISRIKLSRAFVKIVQLQCALRTVSVLDLLRRRYNCSDVCSLHTLLVIIGPYECFLSGSTAVSCGQEGIEFRGRGVNIALGPMM